MAQVGLGGTSVWPMLVWRVPQYGLRWFGGYLNMTYLGCGGTSVWLTLVGGGGGTSVWPTLVWRPRYFIMACRWRHFVLLSGADFILMFKLTRCTS